MEPNYHEREVITLTASAPQSRQQLHAFLKGRGFTSEDEFYYLGRPDTPAPWQSISVLIVNVFYQGSDRYELEDDDDDKPGQWDALKVKYLLATLPALFIGKCAAECETLAARFDLRIELGSVPTQPGRLQPALQQIADNLTAELDEPGSEGLGILIEMSYPRLSAS